MAKQRITVCVPPPSDPADPDALHRAIGEAMAPYYYDREPIPHPDWVGEWDYWFVSGANCPFAVLPGHEDDPRLVRYDEWTESSEELPRGRCHGGPRGLLDLYTDRQAAAHEAARRWDEWARFAAGHPPALAAGPYLDRAYLDPVGYPEERARAEYAAQPLIRAFMEDPELEDQFPYDPIGYFGPYREAFMADRVAEALPTPALLTLDGRWVEYSGPDYRREFNTYLNALPPETMVVRVLYHS
ncbi:hypothetical protein [Streptomyces collinus]|uniref:hypothetical protein n=1 Tax=Streptomyces collinus TaxID=42684 RepID=UPI002943C138|nr:hypothetical protein [Streptomyces collinus]